MKKVLAFLLVAIMVVALAACGGDETSKTPANSDPVGESTPVEDSDPAESTPDEDSTPAESTPDEESVPAESTPDESEPEDESAPEYVKNPDADRYSSTIISAISSPTTRAPKAIMLALLCFLVRRAV